MKPVKDSVKGDDVRVFVQGHELFGTVKQVLKDGTRVVRVKDPDEIAMTGAGFFYMNCKG